MTKTKDEIIAGFDPSQPGLAGNNLFGLPFTAEQSELIVVPVPWEVTVSYGSGAAEGPEAILEASFQVDLHHQEFPDLWKLGIYLDLDGHAEKWLNRSDEYRKMAEPIIEALESGKDIASEKKLAANLDKINVECRRLHDEVRERVDSWIKRGKLVALLGGDHSTPLGYYEALAENYGSFGMLHLDAHMDLRVAYEGFTYSHASIMYNALKIPQLTKLVQVGIRDFCKEEVEVATAAGDRVKIYTDNDLKKRAFSGTTWEQQCDEIISQLPEHVAVSFDIDALYSWYCPNTGTPVPGGISFEQAAYLISRLGESGKNIIGFDLVEVAPGDDDWDGNVGARMLFHMCGVLAKNRGFSTGTPIRF
mgnify:CR=1 FL=1